MMKLPTPVVTLYMVIGVVVSLRAQTLAPTVTGAVIGPTYYAAAYGVIADGVTDQCLGTNLTNLLAAVNATGGSIVFDAGTTVLSSCNFAGINSLGPNVFLVGRGAAQSNTKTTTGFVNPPTILKMTHGVDVAHIECLSYSGQCGAVNLTVQDDTTSLPFFLYTGGIPYIKNVTVWGSVNRTTPGQPVNDGVWLGYMTNYNCTLGAKAAETDGFCDYGLSSIDIYCHNIRVCIQFGSNANGVTAWARGDFTDAYVGAGPTYSPVGGFVQFQADAASHASYGNRVFINNEMAPTGDATHTLCNYLGAFNMVAYATNNIVTMDASDTNVDPMTGLGGCAYTGYIQASNSTRNQIVAQIGQGSSGEISDAAAGSANNIIEDLTARSTTWQNGTIVNLGSSSLPVNRITMGSYTVATLPTTANRELAWVSDSPDGTCAQTILTLTQVSVSGSNAVYSYSSYSGPDPAVGMTIVITGFSNSVNNVTATLTAVSGGASGTVTVTKVSQVNETHAATGTAGGGGSTKVWCWYNSTLASWAPVGQGSSPAFASASSNTSTAVAFKNSAKTFATLDASPVDGEVQFCSNCKVTTPASCSTATPASCVCTSGGSGAFAKRMNYQSAGDNWYCQ